MEKTFTDVYSRNEWLIDSGPGSTIEYNIHFYIPFLRKFILDNNIKNITDLGCGDFKCGRLIYDDLDVKYTGYDCVYQNIINKHSLSYYGSDKYKFIHLDISNNKEDIIGGDMCILKDILCHWKLNNIYTFLDYLVESRKFKYILITNCCGQTEDNTDITEHGCFHSLSCNYFPLKKYNIKKLCNYNSKEISVINI